MGQSQKKIAARSILSEANGDERKMNCGYCGTSRTSSKAAQFVP